MPNGARSVKSPWTARASSSNRKPALARLAIATTALAIFTTTFPEAQNGRTKFIMFVLPIGSALLATIGTRLNQRKKFSQCKMASFNIVSEIYKFRVRAIEYDATAVRRDRPRASRDGAHPFPLARRGDRPVAAFFLLFSLLLSLLLSP